MADINNPASPSSTVPPSAEEAFGNSLPTADEAFGPQAGSSPMSGSFWDSLFSSTVLGKTISAFGQGPNNNWGGQDGWNGQADEYLKKAGYYNDYNSGKISLIKSANEAFVRPAIAALGLAAELPSHIGYAFAEAGKALSEDAQTENKFSPFKYIAGAAGELTSGFAAGGGAEFSGEIPSEATSLDRIPPNPTALTEARSKGIIGEGETGYFNAAPVSKDNFETRSLSAQSIGIQPPEPPTEPYSIDDVARQINPDAFNELDRLQKQQARIRQDIINRTNSLSDQRAVLQGMAPLDAGKNDAWLQGVIEKSRQKLQDTDYALRDLIPDLATARQSAHEALYGDSEYSNMYRDYLQSQLLEKALQEGPVQEAYNHAVSLLPDDYKQELINNQTKLTNKQTEETPPEPQGEPQTASKGVSGTSTPETTESPVQGSEGLTEGNGKLEGQEGTGLKETPGTGPLKPYGGSKTVEAKAVEKGLVDSFGKDIPMRRSVNFKEEAAKVADLINKTDPTVLKRMALGQAEIPEGIEPRFLANELIRNSENPEFLRQMANAPITKELSEHALQMRIAQELDENDPVSIIQNVQNARKEAASKRSGYFLQKSGKDIEGIKKDIEGSVTKASEDIKQPGKVTSFLKSIECDY